MTPAQERAQLRAIVRSESRELEREMTRVSQRTLRVVAQLVRQNKGEMRIGIRVGRAWHTPPPRGFGRRVRAAAGAGGAGADGGTTSFHFGLNQTHSAGSAAAHQSYIEREQACVASFGNIADTKEERIRLWKEIGARSQSKRGSITFDGTMSREVRAHVRDRMAEWVREGRVPHRIGAQVQRLGDRIWDEGAHPIRIWTFDADDHKAVANRRPCAARTPRASPGRSRTRRARSG